MSNSVHGLQKDLRFDERRSQAMSRYGQVSTWFARVLLLAAVSLVTACAGRPTASVLDPATLQAKPQDAVSILTVTNRKADTLNGGFEPEWGEGLSYRKFTISVPPKRKGTEIVYVKGAPDPSRQYVVTNARTLSAAAFEEEIVRESMVDGTLGIFVHGYNNSFQEGLFRAVQVAADAKVGTAPILFSWPSAATVSGYVADKDAVTYSRSDLVTLLKAASRPKSVRRIVLFGHSMGGFLTMEAIRQLKLEGRDDILAKLVVILAAPDIDVDVFRSQMKDVGRMETPITLLVSRGDRALQASSILGGERDRVGRVDVNDPAITEAARQEQLRVIDISSLDGGDALGHNRFASLGKFGAQLTNAPERNKNTAGYVGAFVFDTAGAVVSSPFKLAGSVVRPK